MSDSRIRSEGEIREVERLTEDAVTLTPEREQEIRKARRDARQQPHGRSYWDIEQQITAIADAADDQAAEIDRLRAELAEVMDQRDHYIAVWDKATLDRSAAQAALAVAVDALERIAGGEAAAGVALDARYSSSDALAAELAARRRIAREALDRIGGQK